MTKKITFAVFTLATLLLVGCQQQAPAPQEVKKDTSTATIKVEPSNETSSTGTLTIQSPTSQTTGTLTIGGTQQAQETSATMEKKAMTDTESTGSVKEGAMVKAEGTQKTGN